MSAHDETENRERKLDEICLRILKRRDEAKKPNEEELIALYPELEKEIREMIKYLLPPPVPSPQPPPQLPNFGDDYEVLEEIGRGRDGDCL